MSSKRFIVHNFIFIALSTPVLFAFLYYLFTDEHAASVITRFNQAMLLTCICLIAQIINSVYVYYTDKPIGD